MAELAVGLSRSVVAGAITKVESAIEQDARLHQKVKRDLEFISLEFEMMRSFMDDGAKQEMKSNLVRTWVKQIRQLAYDVEDCVENVVQLDDKPIFWRRFLPIGMCMEAPLPLDEAAEELEQLKGRVEDINNCYRRYNLINESSTPEGSSRTLAVIQQPPPATRASDLLAEARYAARCCWKQSISGDLILTQFIRRHKKDLGLGVICVWGSGGDEGTTSIIRETYDDTRICQDFTYRSWVKIVHPFSRHQFIQALMAQFYAAAAAASSCKQPRRATILRKMEAATTTHQDLLDEFHKIVTQETYLVVLEGLSNIVDWDAIRAFLPDMMNGSRIIVSTQLPEIACLCVGRHSYRIVELERFSTEHSVCALFKELVCDTSQISSPDKILSRKEEATQWMMMNSPLVGRESEINEFRKYQIGHSNFPQVISFWGMAGVGKSSLVRNLYYDMMLQSNQFSEYIWVDVCHPFNLRGFSRSLILDFGSEKDPIQQCRQLLEHHRCLIVIDELNTKEEWDLIQSSLLCTYSTSVIIVITTEANIAAHCTKKKELMFNVQGLEDNAAFHLFEKEVSTKYELPSSWRFTQPWVEELIMKCGGLPRVIVEIANSLGTKSVGLDDSARSLSNNFMHDLETHQQFNNLRGLFSWMHSIILNPPDFLKPCIFYLSIFPPNRIIRRRRIVRRWIAEGYSKESVEINSNENAENFFSELVQMSIFQQVPGLDMTAFNDTRVSLYQVNGFIHEYMVSQQIMEENLVFQLGFRSIPTSQHRGRHLIIQEYWDRDRIVFEGIGLSRLRSLTVFGKWESFFISKSMKMLRVLDLEDASSLNYGDLENMVKTFHRLKFLSLRVHSEIHRLPSSLGDLRQLQTLDIRGTSIVTLPESFTKLHILQYIRAGSKLCSRRCRQGGVEVPGGIGILTALHTLGVVNVNASGGVAFLRELKRLTQLRKLGVYGINKNNCDEFFSSIKWHQYLESLSVQFDKGNQCRLDDISLTCWKLQSLKLYGLNDKLPKLERGRWQTGTSTELSELRKLDLEMTALNKDDIEFLAKQPRLSIMRLRVKQPSLQFYAELSGEEFPTYENVKILQITSSSSSLNVTFGSKTMGNLDLLKVDCSNGSTYEFSGLEHLPELKEVLVTIRSTLSSDEKETLKKKFESQLANHPKSPAVKLQERTILL